MKVPTLKQLLFAFGHEGHAFPRGVHLVVLRNARGTLDAFDDMLLVLDGAREPSFACRCTADPGRPSREHPKRRDGTAVWAPGQVQNGLGFGRHHGEYECLVPLVPIPVDRYDGIDDLTPTRSSSTATQVHRASADHESSVVGAWSEGCIVVANPADFARVMELAKASGQTAFTVTLLAWG